jgi:regulator of protease activity HflC (stomatin/prohibitin superfamily)
MSTENKIITEEKICKYSPGMLCLLWNLFAMIAFCVTFVLSIIILDGGGNDTMGILLLIASILYVCVIGPIFFCGLKILSPNEALVLTLFGKYVGTLKGAGFYQVNPFCVAVNPASESANYSSQIGAPEKPVKVVTSTELALGVSAVPKKKKISLKAMTLNNDMQKINDQLGNPIMIGIVVIWKVTNTAMAVFNVDNFKEFLSIQCDAALRNIVRLYPYDVGNCEANEGADEKSLRGSSDEVALRLKNEIQEKVKIAGLEITEARITNLSYAPEIASAMLQRQQASAVVDARHMIVDGAVGMVEMALARLNDANIVNLDEERKAAMVSNLLVVLCGNRDAQPIVNSGSLY